MSAHPDIPWLAATFDRCARLAEMEVRQDGFGSVLEGIGWNVRGALGGEFPLELKLAEGSAAEWGDEPPVKFMVQVQIQIACAVTTWGALAGLLGLHRPLAVYDIPRDDAFLAAAIPALEKFHWAVENRVPPEPTSALDLEPIKRLYPGGDGSTVALDDDAEAWLSKMEALRSVAAGNETAAAEYEAKLRARVGAGTFGALPGGDFITLRKTKRAGYTVGPCEYRALRRWRPKRPRR